MPSEDLIPRLFAIPPSQPPVAGPDAWWERHRAAAAELAQASPIDRGALAAARMDRVGWAFASGYQAALETLVPQTAGVKAALCATEAGGVHPRAIEARLRPDVAGGWLLSGRKAFVTLGAQAEVLLVVASEGLGEDGKSRLAGVRIPAGRAGVSFEPLPPTPFASEVPHAALVLEGVQVGFEERLPGDGYTDLLKPFRTVEDVCVHAALLAWLVTVGRRAGWPAPAVEGLLGPLVGLRALAVAPPSAPETLLALGGLLRHARAAVDATGPHWERADPEERDRWRADRALLDVAGGARARRLEVARERLGLPLP